VRLYKNCNPENYAKDRTLKEEITQKISNSDIIKKYKKDPVLDTCQYTIAVIKEGSILGDEDIIQNKSDRSFYAVCQSNVESFVMPRLYFE
jgi:hypothetical protein